MVAVVSDRYGRSSGCAQRLAASQTWSRRVEREYYGDILVLNALRRHRHGRIRPPAVGVISMLGAQRLAASQTWSRPDGSRSVTRACVLNALRRHRHGRRIARTSATRTRWVLNALRRHRHGRAGMVGQGMGQACAQRLAASQTWSPGMPADQPREADKCSTPCGVTDMVARGRRICCRPGPCAQRLAASQTWSPASRTISHRLFSCAQRLAASQTWSAAADVGQPDRPEWCSTPCGVTDMVAMTLGNRQVF